jgi:hypothetical protein
MRHVVSAILATSVAVAIVGCSHDTLGSGTHALQVLFSPNPAGAGRYERGPFDIQKLEVLPTDPATGQIFDPVTDTLILRFDAFPANLNATTAIPFSQIALPEGEYQVTLFKITPPALVDENISANPATCLEGVAAVNAQSVSPTFSSFSFINEPQFKFTVRPGQTTLGIKVNVPGLIAGYESAFTCQLGCGPGGAPCLTAFNTATFHAAVLANVKFE